MRSTMATLTGRHHLVFFFMTGNTSHILVLGCGLAVQIKGLLMTGGTHLVGCIGGIGHHRRHMSLVAALALGNGHLGVMRLVTLRTKWNLAMNIMAEAASQIGMLALELLQFYNLRSVAGHTLISYIIGQLDDLRSVRVSVTTEASGQVVVRFSGVALTACGDNFLHGRRMTDVAVLTADAGFVGATVSGNGFRCRRVALDTISIGQNGFGIGGNGNGSQQSVTYQSCTKGFQHFNQFLHCVTSKVDLVKT